MSKSDTDTRTDAACTTAGIYRSDCADQERVTLAIGDSSPRCPSCRKAVGWNLAIATWKYLVLAGFADQMATWRGWRNRRRM
jgi:hypothetical protein